MNPRWAKGGGSCGPAVTPTYNVRGWWTHQVPAQEQPQELPEVYWRVGTSQVYCFHISDCVLRCPHSHVFCLCSFQSLSWCPATETIDSMLPHSKGQKTLLWNTRRKGVNLLHHICSLENFFICSISTAWCSLVLLLHLFFYPKIFIPSLVPYNCLSGWTWTTR